MDLNTVTEVLRPATADSVKEWQSGYAWLAGGTWLFSEPQIATHTLIDLESFQWPSLTILPEGLEIRATCKVAEINHFIAPPEWVDTNIVLRELADRIQLTTQVVLAASR
jgi:hypothetical protein